MADSKEADSPLRERKGPEGFFVVQDGTGNARSDGIESFPKEQKQAVRDVLAWLDKRAGKEERALMAESKPASKDAISNLEAKLGKDGNGLPACFRMLLESHNGGVPIRDSHVTCSIEQIIDLRESTIKGDVIPLSCDIDDDYLVIDRKSGGVFEYSEDEGLGDNPLARSLARYIEKLRDDLLSNQLEWCDGVGLVEVVGAQSPQPKAYGKASGGGCAAEAASMVESKEKDDHK